MSVIASRGDMSVVQALVGGRVLTDAGFVDGFAILIEDDRIAAVIPVGEVPAYARRNDVGGAMLVPGFIDTQVNGGGGVLFNDAPTAETITAIGRAHRRFGTTGFLPTLISDDLSVVAQAIAAVDEAIRAGVPGVLGIHIEGPFLNQERKGVHDPDKFRELDEDGLSLLTSLQHGCTLVTLAPECTTLQMIARLSTRGVIVSAGHTNGSYAEIRSALDNGLRGFTHLFNAMSPLESREPGAVGAALEDRDSWCGLIVDGRHVHPATLRLALCCKPIERCMLVTDAMPSVGQPDKAFMLQGQLVTVVDGVCVNGDGTLAGSDLDMASAVRNSVTMLGVTIETAIRMASLHPAAFLGLENNRGRIAAGYSADLLAIDDDVKVLQSWINGCVSTY